MNILIPMAGAGSRFREAGYTVHKPVIPTRDRRDGREYPMVVCATRDLPGVAPDGGNVLYIDRDFHRDGGVEEAIRRCYPAARFLTLDHLTEGQASTCLLAKEEINNGEELLIAGCDNGMVFNRAAFEERIAASDAVVFTYTRHPALAENPNAYGWMVPDKAGRITRVSVKQPVSEDPFHDHAVVAAFWFRRGSDFVRAAEKMIAEEDRVNGEFYVDEVIRHVLELGLTARIFDVERYIGWGTPKDYEDYTRAFAYWESFLKEGGFYPERRLLWT